MNIYDPFRILMMT